MLRRRGYTMTGFKLTVQEMRPKSLFSRTGQVQAASMPPGLMQGQWVSSSFCTSSATVSRLPQQEFPAPQAPAMVLNVPRNRAKVKLEVTYPSWNSPTVL